MKYKFLAIVITMASISFAQVKDISFTVSPFGQYNWMDNQSGVEENATFIGGTIGFGFGEYLELRALYLQSVDLKTDFSKFGLTNYDASLFTAQDVDVTRWGGELKANIGRGKLNPFITFGTGVQNIALKNGADFDQIYTSFGLGIKAKLTDRIIFTLEGNSTLYNDNAGKNYLSDANKTAFGVTDANFENSLLYNWGARASLQFYLGGRRPGTMTALDRAYMNQFRSGFRGLRLIVEPSANFIEFDTNSQFRNTWLLGGYAGFDFNEYTGIRAFYFRATNNEQISTDFDKLGMYGLEFRARLNDGNGVTPYLILGGGYLNTYNDYSGKNNTVVNGEEFASAGLGLNIPLAKFLLITGGVRGMVTSSSNVEDLTSPESLQTHIMYNAGLKLVFGQKSKNPSTIYNSNVQNALDEQDEIAQEAYNKKLSLQKEKSQAKINDLKMEYQKKLDSLQVELQYAYDANDVEKAVIILENKKAISKDLEDVKKIESKVGALPVTTTSADEIAKNTAVKTVAKENEPLKITAEQLDALVAKAIAKAAKKTKDSLKTAELENKIKQLEEQIEMDKAKPPMQQKIPAKTNQKKDNNAFIEQNEALRNEVEAMKRYNELNSRKIELLEQKTQENAARKPEVITVEKEIRTIEKVNNINIPYGVVDTSIQRDSTEVYTPNSIDLTEVEYYEINKDSVVFSEGRFIPQEKTKVNSNQMVYKGFSNYLGVNFGNQTTVNLGFRANLGIQDTKFEFMPEFYYGVGNPGSFGLTGNVIYPFEAITSDEFLTPYAGFGVGLIRNDAQTKVTQNIVLGTNLKFLDGRLFVDYTIRNFFKYNQLAVGYRYKF